MGEIKSFEPEKLVVGIMYIDDSAYKKAKKQLCSLYGEIDSCSFEYSFSDFSHFYDDEMRGVVKKRFISFKKLVDPSLLSCIKRTTNDIEASFAHDCERTVNIDPCLLGHGKFIMATTKNASFRIPLENGIYADLSLVYARKQWVDFFWTYFDIKEKKIKEYLEQVRDIYLKQRNNIKP